MSFTFNDYCKSFTTQGFSVMLDTMERKRQINLIYAENVKSMLFRARQTNSMVVGTYNEVYFKTMMIQSLVLLNQQRWYFKKGRSNTTLEQSELLDAMVDLDLHMAMGITMDVAKNLAILYVATAVLYAFHSKKTVEMRNIMKKPVDGTGEEVRKTIQLAQELLSDIRSFAREDQADRDFKVAGFLRPIVKTGGAHGKTHVAF